jgi:Bacterial TSP3 repeat
MRSRRSVARPETRLKLAAATALAAFSAMLLFPVPPEARARDRDHDGLRDRFELKRSKTSPRRKDTDRDRLGDGFEVKRSKTNPRRKDTDRDGLRDRFELKRSKTNPRRKDTDRDGLNDRYELKRSKTNPRKKDTDGDGVSDGDEVRLGTNPRNRNSVPPPRRLAPDLGPPGAFGGPLFPPPVTWVCNRTASSSSQLSSQWSAAQPGETICLTTGNYGTFSAGSKPGVVNVRPQAGATPTVRLNFSNAVNVLVEGLTIDGGSVGGSSRNVTVTHNNFLDQVRINSDQAGSNIVFDGNHHVNISGVESRLAVNGGSGVIVRNSLFQGGGSDGVRIAGPNAQIGPGNQFIGFEIVDSNHTDPIQFFSGLPGFVGNTRITGNYFAQPEGTGDVVAYIAAWDGTSNNVIDNNVFRAVNGGSGGGHGIAYSVALYADKGSVIRNNTMERGTCNHNIRCGTIMLASKSGYPAGTGTVIRDNVMTAVGTGNGSSFSADHNLTQTSLSGSGNVVGSPSFVGPLSLWTGWRLAPGSAGKGIGSDGGDPGIR